MKKGKIILAVAIVLILGAYYCHLKEVGTIRETYDFHDIQATGNIISVDHDYEIGDDCIDLAYKVGDVTHSDPDANGTHHDIKYVRKGDEDLDRMIKDARNDGYFTKDVLDSGGLMYRIKGVVYGNVCYYRSEKINFNWSYYRDEFHREGDEVIVCHYLSLWRYVATWAFYLFLAWFVYWDHKYGDGT